MAVQLLTYTEQQTIKRLITDDIDRYNELVIETQENELKRLIGEPLYNDLIDNILEDKYQKLLNGDSWTVNSNKYTQKGLKYVLAYLVYSKWIRQANAIDTYTGLMQQRSDYAEHIDYGTIKQMSEEAYSIAIQAWDEVKNYITNFSALYDKYYTCNTKESRLPNIWTLRRY